MNNIVVYGNSLSCSPCIQLKKFLYEIGVENYTFYDFADEDVLKVRQYKKDLTELFKDNGVLKTPVIPVIFIGDNPKIVGFGDEQKEKIIEYLEK